MVESETSDDVLSLCAFAHISATGYKRFPIHISANEAPNFAALGDETKQPVLTALQENEIRWEPRVLEPPPSESEQDHGPLLVKENLELQREPGLSSLGKVLEKERGMELQNQAPAGDTFKLLPIIALNRGVGVTTVLANLGRALSVLSERVLLIDNRVGSKLNASFGSCREQTVVAFRSDRNRFEKPTYLLQVHAAETTANSSSSTKIYRNLAQLSHGLDYVLMAGADSLTGKLSAEIWGDGKCLCVITPDENASDSVEALLKHVDSQGIGKQSSAAPYFLLNRFNVANPNHFTVRDRLVRKLGDRLLPFVIPDAASVRQAAASGLTVIDHEPQSSFADAFFRLAEWYLAQPEATRDRLLTA